MSIAFKPLPVTSFLKDRRGNVAIIFGLMLIPFLGISGIAIDFSRAYERRVSLQAAADAAALAAVSAAGQSEGQRIATAVNIFKQNLSPDHPEQAPDPDVSINGATATVTASDSVQNSIMSLFGAEETDVSVASKAETNGGKRLEVGMMIDLTGSMGASRGGMTKIVALKLAGNDLLDILYPDGDSELVKTAIAPMATYVNAGPYAGLATGLPETGSYAKRSDLSQTKQGPYSGRYSGATGNAPGSGAACTSSGSDFTNEHCTNPTLTNTTADERTFYVQYRGTMTLPVGTNGSARSYTPGAVRGQYFYRSGYSWYVCLDSSRTTCYYVPVTSTTTSEKPECTQANDQTGPLITCVTDRTNANAPDATDDAPASGRFVGAYNRTIAGASSKSNYSADGKCYVAGRELPAVIPMTNNKQRLRTFFNEATIGGGTPGHLGHAWAWYLISPHWNSVFQTDAVSYTDTGTSKAIIIMTDGEYNMEYSSTDSRDQAIALCTAMKDKGIKVYTIGFGFAENPANGSADSNARQMLTQCATPSGSAGSNNYYFPYDGTALRAAFQDIGNTLISGDAKAKTRLTN